MAAAALRRALCNEVERQHCTGLGAGTGLTRDLDDQFHETDHGTGNLLVDSSFAVR